MEIRKVAVLGAGVMGAGIAAHVANAGVPVVLLDIVPEGATDRNVIAEAAVQKMLQTEPAAFMHKRNAKLITTGNIEDHLELLADVDWIVEAVIENLAIKQGLYRRVDAVRKAGSIVSSNTSTIPLGHLVEGLPAAFAADFLITHFFNPPRYMRLLEIVGGEHTRDEVVELLREFCDRQLGKGVVECKDTPGFIGNRIGTYWLQCAVIEAFKHGLSVEQADAVLGRPMGIPKTGVFGLLDLVGIDLMPHILASMSSTLPKDDAYFRYAEAPGRIDKMIAAGLTGRKGKGGFYRLNRSGGKKLKEAIGLSDGEYRPAVKPEVAAAEQARRHGPRGTLDHDSDAGRYARTVMLQTLAYSASLVPEIADTIVAVDQGMKLGYNWKYGPFELIDQVGVDWFATALQTAGLETPPLLDKAVKAGGFYRVDDGVSQYLNTEGDYVPVPRADGVMLLSDIKQHGQALAENSSASLWDIGDGVLCLEFHSKMNALDPQIMKMIRTAVDIVPKQHRALVIYNEGSHFSAGANLGLALFAANIAAWEQIAEMVKEGQDTYQSLKYAPFPVVAAPFGLTLGGGCEVVLHADAVQAHAETYMGLVEVGVGVIPAWGGCKEMLQRWSDHPKRPGGPMPAIGKVFETVSVATVAKSAAEARSLLFLRREDGITMNRDRLLFDAKQKALALAADYRPPESAELFLPGASAEAAMHMAVDGFRRMGKALPQDVVVSKALAHVLSGGDTDITEALGEDQLLSLEREAFMKLLRTPATLARVEHMLETGKPLRN